MADITIMPRNDAVLEYTSARPDAAAVCLGNGIAVMTTGGSKYLLDTAERLGERIVADELWGSNIHTPEALIMLYRNAPAEEGLLRAAWEQCNTLPKKDLIVVTRRFKQHDLPWYPITFMVGLLPIGLLAPATETAKKSKNG